MVTRLLNVFVYNQPRKKVDAALLSTLNKSAEFIIKCVTEIL